MDACKINAKPGTALNSGYDDDNGSYNKVNISNKELVEMICIMISWNYIQHNMYIYNLSLPHARSSTIIYPIGMKYWKWSEKGVLAK